MKDHDHEFERDGRVFPYCWCGTENPDWKGSVPKSDADRVKEGEQDRDAAMDEVEDHASEDFMREAAECVHALASLKEKFTANDVRDLFKKRQHTEPAEPRAWGPVMMRAKASEWIVPTDEFVKSKYRTQHASPVRVWRSLILS